MLLSHYECRHILITYFNITQQKQMVTWRANANPNTLVKALEIDDEDEEIVDANAACGNQIIHFEIYPLSEKSSQQHYVPPGEENEVYNTMDQLLIWQISRASELLTGKFWSQGIKHRAYTVQCGPGSHATVIKSKPDHCNMFLKMHFSFTIPRYSIGWIWPHAELSKTDEVNTVWAQCKDKWLLASVLSLPAWQPEDSHYRWRTMARFYSLLSHKLPFCKDKK